MLETQSSGKDAPLGMHPEKFLSCRQGDGLWWPAGLLFQLLPHAHVFFLSGMKLRGKDKGKPFTAPAPKKK